MARIIRLKDVAEASHFSLSTVSRALNNDPEIAVSTVKQIKLIANQMGYIKNKEASALRNGVNQNVVLVSMVGTSTNDVFFNPKNHEIQDGAYSAISKTDLTLFVLPVSLENIITKVDSLCKENRPTGLIIDGQYLRAETIKTIKKFNVPMVVLHNKESLEVPNVIINQDSYVYEAIKSFRLKGVKKIYVCHSLAQTLSHHLYQEGIKHALSQSLKSYDITHQYEELFSSNQGFSEYAERIIKNNQHTSIGFIVTSTNYSAAIYSACMHTTSEIGKNVHLATLTSIPEFFAIIHAQSDIWYVDFKEVGKLLVNTLLQFISGIDVDKLQKSVSPARIEQETVKKHQQDKAPKAVKITILDL